jgi:hypothetical protein
MERLRPHVTLIRFVIYHLYSMNLQLLIYEEQTIFRKNTLFVLPSNIETTDEIQNYTRNRVNFLLCRSCFWCASCLSQDSTFTKCPSCTEGNIESLPIAENENYRFDNDRKRGITMEFFRRV